MNRTIVIVALLLTAGLLTAAPIRHADFAAVDYFGIGHAEKSAMDAPTSIFTSFEATDTLDDWYIFNANEGSTYWTIFEAPTLSHSGSNFAGCLYDTLFSSTLANDDWLVTSRVEITDDTYELRFWVRSYDVDDEWLDDYEVLISPTGDTLIETFTDMVDAMSAVPSVWQERVIDLSDYAGQTIRVAFRYVSWDKWLLMIDDIEIGPGTPVAEGRQLAREFELVGNTPNPFNATTTIWANTNGSGTVEIFDVMGKFVATVNIDGGRGVWDGQHDNGAPAESGVYFYRLANSQVVHRMVLLK